MTQRMLLLFSALVLAFSFDVATALANPDYPELQSPELPSHTCHIQGIVMKSERYVAENQKKAPSAFNDIYTRLTVRVQRAKEYDNFRGQRSLAKSTVISRCSDLVQEGLDTTFRLCSTEKPKIGDIIMGIGSISPIPNQDACVFDIRVVGNALKELREREKIDRLKSKPDQKR